MYQKQIEFLYKAPHKVYIYKREASERYKSLTISFIIRAR
jgi:hypothetical protein